MGEYFFIPFFYVVRPFGNGKNDKMTFNQKNFDGITMLEISHSFRKNETGISGWERLVDDGCLCIYALSEPNENKIRKVVKLLSVPMKEFERVAFSEGRTKTLITGQRLYSRYYNMPFYDFSIEGNELSVRVGMNLMEISPEYCVPPEKTKERLLKYVKWVTSFK